MISYDDWMKKMNNPEGFFISNERSGSTEGFFPSNEQFGYTKPTEVRWKEMSEAQKDAADLTHILAHPELYSDDGEEIDGPLPEFVLNESDSTFLNSCGWSI